MMNELSNNLPDQPVIPNTSYEFRVNGRLTQETTTWFEDMTLVVDETTAPPQTIIQASFGIRQPCMDSSVVSVTWA